MKQKKQQPMPQRQLETFEPRKIKARVIGLGGGGCSIALEMAKKIKGVSFVLADTDSRVFSRALAGGKVSFFKFGEKLLNGMGSGLNVELAKKAAENEKEKIEKLFAGYDLVVLVCALGGGVGSGCLPVFAEIANKQKVLTLGFFTLPFEFEGEKKIGLAKKTYLLAKKDLSGCFCVSNEKIFKLVDKKTPLKKALSALNNQFSSWLGALLDIVLKPSLINIDFADLKTILKDKNQDVYFAQGQSQKENKAEEVLRQILDQPLFGKPPQGVSKVLYHIAISKNTALADVEKVSSGIYSLNPKAKIIFGLSQENNTAAWLGVSLLAVAETGREILNSKKLIVSGKEKTKNKQQKTGGAGVRKAVGMKKKKNNKENSAHGAGRGLAFLKNINLERKNALEVKQTKDEKEQEEWANSQAEANGQNWQVPAFLRKGS